MRIGIDIGGTFTDFTVIDTDGSVTTFKEDSTPHAPLEAITRGLAIIAEQRAQALSDFLGEARLLVHGTTAATNQLIQRNGPTIGLVCTSGFRDILYFRDGFKPRRYDLHLPYPENFVDRWLRLGVKERIDSSGAVIEPLDEEAIREAAQQLRDAGVKAVAVCFLWSIVNPMHEDRAAEILREELPGVYVVCSHDVLPEMREWERTSATVLSAYILPKIGTYLDELQAFLSSEGLAFPPQIMQINGGCSSVQDIIARPINILASGPAAAPAAALAFKETTGEDIIVVDMGGTSFDVCLISRGQATMSRFVQVEEQPIGVPAVHIHSVGAGGGSIAYVDSGGALCVGPQSAGADPGPACYDRGGERPTVTDANLVLGYLNPDGFRKGRKALRKDLAEEAIRKFVGDPLGLDPVAAAAGIIAVVNSHMASAIRAVSVEQGIDPRNFTLLSGGGAGGLHASTLARSIGMDRCFIPHVAGVLCSFGMTETDVRHDFTRALRQTTQDFDLSRVLALYAEMEEQAVEQLRIEGFDQESIRTERWADARYPGQHHELTVRVTDEEIAAGDLVSALKNSFNAAHERSFGWADPSLDVEFLHWRVIGLGIQRSETVTQDVASSEKPSPLGTRAVYVESSARLEDAPFYAAADIVPGHIVDGPCVIESPTTTILVRSDETLTALPTGYLIRSRE